MNSTENKLLKETEVFVVLDRSGSMSSISQATVDGFNTFLKEQKGAEGEAFLTLVQFDDRYEIDYKSKPVNEVADLINGETFVPRGMTALLDAIGKTIEETTTDRDVIFVIITDGHENASKTYTREAINKMIETQTNDKGWKFLFLAANQDAIQTGGSIGIKASNAMTYSADNISTVNMFNSVSSNMRSYRKSKFSSMSVEDLQDIEKELNFTQEQRDQQK